MSWRVMSRLVGGRLVAIVVSSGVVLAGAVACSSDPDPAVTTSADRASESSPSTTEPETVEAPGAPAATPADPPPVIPAFEPGPIEWERFNDAVDVGTLEVPVDYSAPDGARFELFLARYHALDQENKIGTLLVNPGGPGFGGSDLALTAAQRFDRPLLERFDIIGWDPRGTGESDPPVDCIADYDTYFTAVDSTPETAAERAEIVALAEQFADGCVRTSGEIVEHVGTNSSARDIDVIRRALGEDTISFFGFSYGSELGGVWATMFPDTVRAIVIDGAADPEADRLESTLQQLRGFEGSLTTFLAECSADEECEFHNDGDSEGAFDALLERLDAEPVAGSPDRPPVNRDVAIGGVVLAMYSDAFWPSLAKSLAAAAEGDGSGLLQLYDSYYRRAPDGTWGNEIEAFRVISCADTPERPTVAEIDAEMAAMHEVAPRLVPEGAVGGYDCTFFAPAVDPRIAITAAGAGPVVVIGTTGDPSTTLESTRRMRDSLEDGRLVVVEADQHTGYGVNRCVIDIVNDYLIELDAPDDDTRCS